MLSQRPRRPRVGGVFFTSISQGAGFGEAVTRGYPRAPVLLPLRPFRFGQGYRRHTRLRPV